MPLTEAQKLAEKQAKENKEQINPADVKKKFPTISYDAVQVEPASIFNVVGIQLQDKFVVETKEYREANSSDDVLTFSCIDENNNAVHFQLKVKIYPDFCVWVKDEVNGKLKAIYPRSQSIIVLGGKLLKTNILYQYKSGVAEKTLPYQRLQGFASLV